MKRNGVRLSSTPEPHRFDAKDRADLVASVRSALDRDEGVLETRPLIQPTPVKGPAS